jgi:AraC-like DNA-binding protein/mannose-6-phosphate isomerase-like protein (cupin superfamily)
MPVGSGSSYHSARTNLYVVDVATPEVLRLSEYTLGRPYYAALVHLTPREATGVHTHGDFFEFFYVRRGTGDHVVPKGRQALSAGDLVFVGATEWHALTTLAPGGMEWINVAVPSSFWQSMCDLTDADPSRGHRDEGFPRLVHLEGAAAAVCEAAFGRALERCTLGPSRLDLLRLVVEVLELLPDPATLEDAIRPEWLVRARQAMEREDNLQAGVSRMLELAAVSPAHLSRSVRTFYGSTPTALVTDLRARHAEMLLATTSLNLTEIATRCGFSSLSYFSRCFRATQGVSPREYRRRARLAVLP